MRFWTRLLGLGLVVAAIMLVPMLAMAAPVTQGLSGTVTDAATHLPMQGVEIHIQPTSGNPTIVYTAADGSYGTTLTADTYTVYADATYYEEGHADDVVVGSMGVTTQDFALVRWGEPVYRFFNYRAGVHFYTASEIEKDNVIANLSNAYHFEGVAWVIDLTDPSNTVPVYRFYNIKNGMHFYTSSESERAITLANPRYASDGVAFYASADPSGQPVYRYYNPRRDAHFFSATLSEIFGKLSNVYHYEGIAFYINSRPI